MRKKDGNTLLEVLFVVAATGIFSAILLPAVAMIRHAASIAPY